VVAEGGGHGGEREGEGEPGHAGVYVRELLCNMHIQLYKLHVQLHAHVRMLIRARTCTTAVVLTDTTAVIHVLNLVHVYGVSYTRARCVHT
jgi:hypothetical protein